MTHREKDAYLLRDLGQRGIRPRIVAPPIYRLLWHLGVEVRPPHFASFWWFVAVLPFYLLHREVVWVIISQF